MKVFLSYAREDIDAARRIYDYLKSIEELSLWLDEENLHPGDDWRDAIFAAIKECRLFILILSRVAFARKRFLEEEIAAAVQRQTNFPEDRPFIVPVRLDDCNLVGAIGHIQAVDLGNDWLTGMEQLRLTVVRALTTSLSDAFQTVNEHWTLEERSQWIESYGDFVLQFSATTVLRYLDEKYEVYFDEIYAIRLMIEVSQAARSESLTAYVLRLHEIARLAHNGVSESFQASGAFLEASKLVPANVHGILLRHALDAWLELGVVWGNTFPPCLILLDVAKHYLVQREGRYKGDFEITLECARVLCRYDVLLADLLVFYARRTGNYNELVNAVRLLASHYAREIAARCPHVDEDSAPFLTYVNLEKTEHVDSFSRKPPMPMLLVRIGEYLRQSDDNELRNYGLWLKNEGLDLLRQHRSANRLVEPLESSASLQILDAMERHDIPTTASLLGIGSSSATYLIEEAMITSCSYSVPGLTYHLLPSIDPRAFREHDPGLIGFRR